MHNNIMSAGSRDPPPMLATGRYPQWRSRFLRYIDTRPNGDALRKCILEGPYTPSTVIIPDVPAKDNSLAVLERTTVETILNMSPENKAHFESEKEAIHLILTGIGDEIYSTVDACKTAHEMWEAIKRLQKGESLNIQDVKTNLFWEFGKFTSDDGETMESYYSRFYKLMNEIIRNNLTVATMQVNTSQKSNPLALVAAAQLHQDLYYQASKSYTSYTPTTKTSLPTRSHATTRHKGKEIVKPIIPSSESASEEDNDPEPAQKDKEMALIAKNQRTMTVAGTRETVGDQVVQQSGIQCFNCKNVNKSVALTNLITNLKLDADENKKIQKQLKKENTSLAHELTECKSILAETSRTLEESNSIRDSHVLTPLALKTQNDSFAFVHELKQEMHADLKYVESLEFFFDEIESDKAKFANMYDMLLQECVSNDVMCSYLHSLSDLDAYTELQCLYLHKVKECECLA
ncbi:hypothetical protein Tco_1383394 [Tanacetum coccineum]